MLLNISYRHRNVQNNTCMTSRRYSVAMRIHWAREARKSFTISHDTCHYVLTHAPSLIYTSRLPQHLPSHSSPPNHSFSPPPTQSQQHPRTTLNIPWPPQTTPSAAPAPPPTPHSSQAPTSTPSSAAPSPPPTPRHPSLQTPRPSTPSADPPT